MQSDKRTQLAYNGFSVLLNPRRLAGGGREPNSHYYTPCTKINLKLCVKQQLTFSRLCAIIDTERKREVITMTRFNDNWFDVMFDEAVEELEKENEKN